MKIGVFCSANQNIQPSYIKATEEFGRWMGMHNHTLVWGGCALGLMNSIGIGFLEGRTLLGTSKPVTMGKLIGVVPDIIEERGKTFQQTDCIIDCKNLSERKDIIAAQSDILVALPGGIGTIDEIFTVAAASTIGYSTKKIILYDIEGFWIPLFALMDHLEQQGMMRGNYRNKFLRAENIEQITKLIETIKV